MTGASRSAPSRAYAIPSVRWRSAADGGRLAAASFDRTVKVWDTTTGEAAHTSSAYRQRRMRRLQPGRPAPRLGRRGQDGARLGRDRPAGRCSACRGHTGGAGAWRSARTATPRLGQHGQNHPHLGRDPAPGGRRPGTPTFTGHGDEIRSVAFSPGRPRTIASAGIDRLVKVWDATTGLESASVRRPHGCRLRCGVAPRRPAHCHAGSDGANPRSRLGYGSTGPTPLMPPGWVRLPRGGVQPRRPLPRHREHGPSRAGLGRATPAGRSPPSAPTSREVRGVVFSPDGEHLASASGDGEVKLWDATRLDQKQEARHTLAARVPAASLNVAFSPDGRRLATGGEDNTVKIWDVQTGERAAAPFGATTGRSTPSRSVPRRPVDRLRRRGQHRESLGQRHRKAGPQLPRAHRHRQQRDLQPRRPPPRLGQPRSHGQSLGRRPGGTTVFIPRWVEKSAMASRVSTSRFLSAAVIAADNAVAVPPRRRRAGGRFLPRAIGRRRIRGFVTTKTTCTFATRPGERTLLTPSNTSR